LNSLVYSLNFDIIRALSVGPCTSFTSLHCGLFRELLTPGPSFEFLIPQI